MEYIAAGFDPTGSRFAAVYPALNGHRLLVSHIKGTVPVQEVSCDKGVKVTSLTWALTSNEKPQPRKKRRRQSTGNQTDSFVCLGTSDGVVHVYSVGLNQFVARLSEQKDAIVNAVVDLTIRKGRLLALHSDGSIAEWDLSHNVLVRTTKSGVTEPHCIALVGDTVIVASTAPHALAANDQGSLEMTFTGFGTTVQQILPLDDEHFACRAAEDRQVLVYKLGEPRAIYSLICPSTNAISLATDADASVLAVTTEDGVIKLFDAPLEPVASGSSSGRGAAKIAQATPKGTISVKGSPALYSEIINDSILVVIAHGFIPVIARGEFRSDGTLVEDLVLSSPELPQTTDHLVNGSDPAAAPIYREASATVASGEHVAALESDDESDEEGETLAEKLEALEVQQNIDEDKSDDELSDSSDIADQDDADDDDDVDKIQKRPPVNQKSKKNKELRLKLSQPGSFTVLLSQSLKLNDKQLLELCLSERSEKMIKASIVKLEPRLAAELLENLAATMARSENRNLVNWIKWTMIIHGGYLVTVPNLLKTLASLHSTMSSRVATLPRLLALQGKLELLDVQISVRREAQESASMGIDDDDSDHAEVVYDEESVIVNGEEDFASNSDEELANGIDGEDHDDSSSGASEDDDGIEELEGFEDL